ncbi:pilus assembly protein CpaD [Rhizomicrobium palustre]|uniref:Pilus assembly protein CpaD n=1 Tax=Rhizomicrobium palustre TaxID=189966 RepID=A0A846MWI4_9PROT|nr:CpaD family pilus assembly protein [Rhizomicrobium palustre]NIK87884.1 pilus assembly protein CpaD [Rhizomicrobium palustre]
MTGLKDVLRAAAVGAVLLAGSCAGPDRDGTAFTDPSVNHPISVEPHFAAIKLNFAASEQGLLPDDAAKFEGFVADFMSRGSGSISVSAPQGSDSVAVLRYFGARLSEMGVPRGRILVGTHEGADKRVEIGFIAYTASTKPCGDWSENLGKTYDNTSAKNFGCAVQQNIAAQVADPRDLLEMRPSDPSDAARRAVVIGNYENGKPTAAEKTKDQSGAVSKVNKD